MKNMKFINLQKIKIKLSQLLLLDQILQNKNRKSKEK